MPRIAVILAGCGRMDGSEVHESTLSLLYLAQGGATYQCFAPNEQQARVVDHVTNLDSYEARNQMAEAGRIARGDIQPITACDPEAFDALVVPGGSGGFENLSQGEGDVHPELRRLFVAMADAGKPIAVVCIAPVLAARALGEPGVRLTIGDDAETAAMIEATGATHVECAVDACVADEAHRVVSTPAYMLGPGIADVAAGIEAAMEQLLAWCE